MRLPGATQFPMLVSPALRVWGWRLVLKLEWRYSLSSAHASMDLLRDMEPIQDSLTCLVEERAASGHPTCGQAQGDHLLPRYMMYSACDCSKAVYS